jgi:glycosyltransferase involved in cell wall biosynthesis
MDNKLKVSILMNCYNSDTYLKESIESVLDQTYDNWEIIFWDNQSTDDSAKIAKSYKDKRIRYFYAPVHTSLYEGRNFALKYCSGEYLAFLDCDDLWMSTKLEKQVNILDSNKETSLVYSNTIFFDSDNNTQKILNKKSMISGYIFSENMYHYKFSLETVMVRMSVVTENKVDFGKQFNMIGDRDFLSTVCFYGNVYYVDEVLGKWRIHSNNYSKVLHSTYPKELKIMFLRFKKRFKNQFTRDMRVSIYNEIIIRDSFNQFEKSGYKVRKKLNKISLFNLKGIALRLLSYLPKKTVFAIIQLFKRV